VELARLEEKSATFAKNGCLFGGWFAKCYRRMRQMIRLLKYVRRAVSDAKNDPSHPAHALAAREETSQKLLRAADNLATGFKKLQGKDGFGEAFATMSAGPESLRAVAAAVEGAENRSLTDEETVAMENTRAIEGARRGKPGHACSPRVAPPVLAPERFGAARGARPGPRASQEC